MEYQLPCGCKLKQHSDFVKDCDGLPSIEIDYYNIRNCNKTWELLKTGRTTGVFQLENQLGQDWSAKVEPWNLEDLGALTALLRPGCLNSFIGDKSVTQHYADRNTGREPIETIHPALEILLKDTHQVITYQEQILRIANDIAGFTLGEADMLRKAIGKKDTELMKSIKKSFIDGCIRVGKIDSKFANELFDMIEASQRYLFNKSHSISYGTITYYTAYMKSHFPLHFYTAYLEEAKDKDEIKEIIEDGKDFEISVNPPKLSNSIVDNYGRFCIVNKNIDFGISSIKGLGKSHVQKLFEAIKENNKKLQKDIKNYTWMEFLCNITNMVSSTTVENLILVGAVPDLSVSRKRKAYEYKIYSQLTDRELLWINNNQEKTLLETLDKYKNIERKDGGPATCKRRASLESQMKILEDPSYNLDDPPEWICNEENEKLGISLTYNIMETKMATDYTCADFLAGKSGKIEIACEISSLRETVIKNGTSAGKKMAFLTLKDQFAKIKGVAFAEIYESFGSCLFQGNTVLIKGIPSKKDDKTLMVTNVQQL